MLFTIAWERYKVLGNILGDFQGRAFTVLFYFTIMVPFGIGTRLLGDPLHLKNPPQGWVEHEPLSDTLEDARRQG